MVSSRARPSIKPSYPSSKPITEIERSALTLAIVRSAAFMPGASPPDVKTAIRFIRDSSFTEALRIQPHASQDFVDLGSPHAELARGLRDIAFVPLELGDQPCFERIRA